MCHLPGLLCCGSGRRLGARGFVELLTQRISGSAPRPVRFRARRVSAATAPPGLQSPVEGERLRLDADPPARERSSCLAELLLLSPRSTSSRRRLRSACCLCAANRCSSSCFSKPRRASSTARCSSRLYSEPSCGLKRVLLFAARRCEGPFGTGPQFAVRTQRTKVRVRMTEGREH